MATMSCGVSLFRYYFLAAFAVLPCRSIRINLGGTWGVSNASTSVSVNGHVPGSVHMALFRSGKIDDPYFRFNDVKYRWIAKENWTYSRDFEGVFFSFLSAGHLTWTLLCAAPSTSPTPPFVFLCPSNQEFHN